MISCTFVSWGGNVIDVSNILPQIDDPKQSLTEQNKEGKTGVTLEGALQLGGMFKWKDVIMTENSATTIARKGFTDSEVA